MTGGVKTFLKVNALAGGTALAFCALILATYWPPARPVTLAFWLDIAAVTGAWVAIAMVFASIVWGAYLIARYSSKELPDLVCAAGRSLAAGLRRVLRRAA